MQESCNRTLLRPQLESLETRRLLAQTPELLFSVRYDLTDSDPSPLGPVHRIGDAYVARTTVTAEEGLVEIHRADGTNVQLQGLPGQAIDDRSQVVFNDELYFFFNDDDGLFTPGVGQQLWKTDGTTVELLKKISTVETFLNSTFAFEDHLYFLADAESGSDFGANGEVVVPGDFGIWRTDGTPDGTVPQTDLVPGIRGINTTAEFNDRMVLNVQTDDGSALWSFDGTAEGTRQIAAKVGDQMQAVGNTLFFAGTTDEQGQELYVTDGTPEGTRLVTDLVEGAEGSSPGQFFAFNNELYFHATSGAQQARALWRTDGTAVGTVVIRDKTVGQTAVVGDRLYFTSDTGLYRTDGTPGNAEMLDNGDDGTPMVLASNENFLVYATGGETFSVANGEEPKPFSEPDGPIIALTSDAIIYGTTTTEESTRPDEFDNDILWRTVTFEVWSYDGTDTEALIEPYVLERPFYLLEIAEFQRQCTANQACPMVDDVLVFELYTRDEFGDNSERSAYSVNLPDEEPVVERLAGDADESGEVDFNDFLALSRNFGKVDAVWADGDFDGDGEVAFQDFLLLSAFFGRTSDAE